MEPDDLSFLAAMLVLVPAGHATPSEYERLADLSRLYLDNRSGVHLPVNPDA